MAREKMKQKRKEKIDHIVDTAIQVFAEKGYHGALTDEIADRAGISKRSMYYYVGDKDTLYEQVIKKLLDRFTSDLTYSVSPDETDEENIRGFIKGVANSAKIIPFHAIILRELFSGGENIPASFGRDLNKTLTAFHELFSRHIEERGYIENSSIVVGWMAFSFFVMWEITMPYFHRANIQREEIDKFGPHVNDKLVGEVEKILFDAFMKSKK